jgi:tRNA-modifying protein YgfZ
MLHLGERCLLQVHGPDAVRYLNGQVTQDVRRLLQAPGIALPACVTDAKGRLQAYVTLYLRDATQPILWIEAPMERRDALFARLSRYLIADDAEIEDISDDYSLIHRTESIAGEEDFSHARIGVQGWDRWLPASAALPDEPMLDPLEAERIRIGHGIPAWGRELTEGMLPPEAALDATALSYHKGCYIGQEVLSRIKSAGKINRRLEKFLLECEAPPAAGTLLLDETGAEVGELTSVAHPHALGYLHKKAFGKTSFALADGKGACYCKSKLS